MRILMPVDGSEFSKAAVSFVASRATLLKNPTEVELINVQYPVSLRVSRAAGKELVQWYHEAEAAKALKSAAAALKRAGRLQRLVVGGQACSEPDEQFVQPVVADMHQQSSQWTHRMVLARTQRRLRNSVVHAHGTDLTAPLTRSSASASGASTIS
jgi:hypothetical protein